MRISQMVTAVDAHAAGEPGRDHRRRAGCAGATMFEKMKYLEKHGDDLRKRMLREPRGATRPSAAMSSCRPPRRKPTPDS